MVGYSPSMNMGAYVVVVNAEKIEVTGAKADQKMYRRHSGRPGGLKEETFRQLQKVLAFHHALHTHSLDWQLVILLLSFIALPNLTPCWSVVLRPCGYAMPQTMLVCGFKSEGVQVLLPL